MSYIGRLPEVCVWCFEIIEARRCQPITASDSVSCLARAKRAAEDKKRDFTSISERKYLLMSSVLMGGSRAESHAAAQTERAALSSRPLHGRHNVIMSNARTDTGSDSI